MSRTYPRILFGNTEFSGDDFVSANLTEEFSPLSITLPISTLEFSVYASNTDFSVINPSGEFESLATIQPMTLYEVVGNTQVYLGQFYLDEWSNKGENIKQFVCYDIFGLLDKLTYLGGMWLSPITVGELISGILDPIDVQYEIDPVVSVMTLTGWLPISTIREALQHVAFAAGAYIMTARQDSIVIGKLSTATIDKSGVRTGVAKTGHTRVYQLRWRSTQNFVYTPTGVITKGYRAGVPDAGQSRIWGRRWRASQWEGVKPIVDIPSSEQAGRTVNLRPQVTGVEVVGHDIIEGTGSLEVINQTMPVGFHEIHFTQPLHSLSITGASIVQSGVNYAIIQVTMAGTVVLTGLVYVVSDILFGTYLDYQAGRKDNILKISNASMVNSNNGPEICLGIFNYYQQRYFQNMKLFSPSKYTEVGATVDIETLYANRFFGVVERMSTDLTGGNISDTDVVGIIK